MTDLKTIPVSLAEQAAEIGRKRAAAQADYARLSLTAAEGEAKARAAAEAQVAEAQRAAKQAADVRVLVATQVAHVERLDAAVAEMRAALLAMRDGNAALGAVLGAPAHQSIHDFNLKLP